MEKIYYYIICNIIWDIRKIKLMIKYHTFDLENVEPADYEDLANF